MKSMIAAAAVLMLATAPDPTALFASGDFSGASEAARATLAQAPADSKALLVAGTVALYRNDLATASADLDRIPPGSPEALEAAHLVTEIHQRDQTMRHDDVTFGRARDIVPFVESLPLPVVSVTVDGHRALLAIDSGAPLVALDRDFAKSLGLPAAPSHHGAFADGKEVELPEGRIATLGLGSATIRNLSADLLPIHEMMRGPKTIDGVLGGGILERFAAFTLDYAGGNLVTYSPAADTAAESETTMPLYLVGDHLLAVRSTIAGIDGLSLIDTGLIGAGIVPSKSVIDRAHLALTDGGIGTVPSGAQRHVSTVVVPEVRIGNSVEHDIPGMYAPGRSLADAFPFAVNGTISHGFFDHRSVTFDLTHMRLSISPHRSGG